MDETLFLGAAALRKARPEARALRDSRLDAAALAAVSLHMPKFHLWSHLQGICRVGNTNMYHSHPISPSEVQKGHC